MYMYSTYDLASRTESKSEIEIKIVQVRLSSHFFFSFLFSSFLVFSDMEACLQLSL